MHVERMSKRAVDMKMLGHEQRRGSLVSKSVAHSIASTRWKPVVAILVEREDMNSTCPQPCGKQSHKHCSQSSHERGSSEQDRTRKMINLQG